MLITQCHHSNGVATNIIFSPRRAFCKKKRQKMIDIKGDMKSATPILLTRQNLDFWDPAPRRPKNHIFGRHSAANAAPPSLFFLKCPPLHALSNDILAVARRPLSVAWQPKNRAAQALPFIKCTEEKHFWHLPQNMCHFPEFFSTARLGYQWRKNKFRRFSREALVGALGPWVGFPVIKFT